MPSWRYNVYACVLGGVREGVCAHMLAVGHEDGLVTVWRVPQTPPPSDNDQDNYQERSVRTCQ